METGGFLTYQINTFRKSVTLTDTMKLDSTNWKNRRSTTAVVAWATLDTQAGALTVQRECRGRVPLSLGRSFSCLSSAQRAVEGPEMLGLVRNAEPWVPPRPTF